MGEGSWGRAGRGNFGRRENTVGLGDGEGSGGIGSFAEASLAVECLLIDFWFDGIWGTFECALPPLLISIWLCGCMRCRTGPGGKEAGAGC